MRILSQLLMLLLVPCAWGQTATTAPKSITTGTGAPATKVVFQVPKNGWASFTLVPANIPPVAVNIPALTGPITLPATTTFTFTCTIPSDANIITNPDGTKTITNMQCAIKPGVTTP